MSTKNSSYNSEAHTSRRHPSSQSSYSSSAGRHPRAYEAGTTAKSYKPYRNAGIRHTTPQPQRAPRNTRNYRGGRGQNSGYQLRQHSINFSSSNNALFGYVSREQLRGILLLAAGIIALLLLLFALGSCMRACTAKKPTKQAGSSNIDSRIAAKADPAIAKKLLPALNKASLLEKIAEQADKYTDPRMIDLALTEPAALSFVAKYPSIEDKSTQAYSENAEKGSYPELYTFDKRWANADYADGAFGVTGSGPTALAIAYIGLTGKTDQGPASIAQNITKAKMTDDVSGLSEKYFDQNLQELGISSRSYTVSAENIQTALEDASPLIMKTKEGTLDPYVHWIFISGFAEDSTIQVCDPLSQSVTQTTWSANSLAQVGDIMYTLKLSDSSTENSTEESQDS